MLFHSANTKTSIVLTPKAQGFAGQSLARPAQLQQPGQSRRRRPERKLREPVLRYILKIASPRTRSSRKITTKI
jgi:hypothetical protein